jgi:ABC-type siderophore export system fused ATPase/permease subunit
VLIAVYFSLTSLSTVGFGDYHPRANSERIFCAIILVLGVMIFSYIMGNFIAMIESYKVLNAEPDEGDELSKFFGLMKRYNKNKDLKPDLKKRIEEYFQFRWAENRMAAIDEDEEKELLE